MGALAPADSVAGKAVGADALTMEHADGLQIAYVGPLMTLAAGDVLVAAGEAKADIFRLVAGSLCARSPNGDVLEFIFPGDMVGTGALDRHMWTVSACTDAQVSRLPPDAVKALVSCDPALVAQRDRHTEREFEILKRQLEASGRLRSTVRLANLLVVLSRTNVREGRDPALISDDLAGGVVAEQIGFSIEVLETALVSLARQGLIAAVPGGGLRLRDLATLEAFAEGAPGN